MTGMICANCNEPIGTFAPRVVMTTYNWNGDELEQSKTYFCTECEQR